MAAPRQTARELGGVTVEVALDAVREDRGLYNWVLVTPDWGFVNAGSLSVLEMVKWLPDTESYFGLLRMGFGSGRFRRTKWISITWLGPRAGASKSSKLMRARGAATAAAW